jgi:hypothetical protein
VKVPVKVLEEDIWNKFLCMKNRGWKVRDFVCSELIKIVHICEVHSCK